MKKKWRIVKIIATLVVLGFLLGFSIKEFRNEPLNQININLAQTDLKFIDEKDLKDKLGLNQKELKNKELNIFEIEKKSNAIPYVDSANVYQTLDGALHLDIRQKKPTFRVNNGAKQFYVDAKNKSFPTSKFYAEPCLLVTGNIQQKDYEGLNELVKEINEDAFFKKYFIGIEKVNRYYNLLTNDGNFKVEFGKLDHIAFKLYGFKTFVEKYLVYQDLNKYSKISLRFNNQIVTTLKPEFIKNNAQELAEQIVLKNYQEGQKNKKILYGK